MLTVSAARAMGTPRLAVTRLLGICLVGCGSTGSLTSRSQGPGSSSAAQRTPNAAVTCALDLSKANGAVAQDLTLTGGICGHVSRANPDPTSCGVYPPKLGGTPITHANFTLELDDSGGAKIAQIRAGLDSGGTTSPYVGPKSLDGDFQSDAATKAHVRGTINCN
jgi:hypothetical protein